MISPELEAQILRSHRVEKWPPGTIASQLNVDRSVVERVLAPKGVAEMRQTQPLLIERFVPFMTETLQKYPRLPASRLFEMVKARGYSGRPSQFRAHVARMRPPRATEAYLRLKTLKGEQAQVDWAHFGSITIGRATRKLMAFVMVLSWCRAVFLRFFCGARLSNFLRGHQQAFEHFGGVTRVVLYDNLKSAVLERFDRAIHFHPTLLELAKHYCFEPRPVAVARGNEKGRVERAIRYARSSFFPARTWTDLDDLNRQATEWCLGLTMERLCQEDKQKTVGQAFKEERSVLLPLPPDSFPCQEREEVRVAKTPYVRFDWNDYSVPHTWVRKHLTVLASTDTVRILSGNEIVATHARSYDRWQQIENPAHIEALVQQKHAARQHRGIDRLAQAVPVCTELLEQLALKKRALGSCVKQLLVLLDTYGAAALTLAVEEALKNGAAHPHAVRCILEREQMNAGLPAALALSLNPKLRDVTVTVHDLKAYDQLKESNEPSHTAEPPIAVTDKP